MAITDYGSISQRTAAWAALQMLSHAEPVLVLSKFAQTKPLPRNKADNVKFRRPRPFPVATTPLIEGVQPTPRSMQYDDVDVSLLQYGDVVTITDWVHDLSEDPVLSDATMLCGEQAGETLEYITWGVVRGGTSANFANGTQRDQVNTPIETNDIRLAVRDLKGMRGKPLNKMLSGSPDHNTTPIEGGYIAFAHTNVEHDLREMTGFVPVAQYGSRKPLCPEEIGTLENVRFILSPVLDAFPDAGAAHGGLVLSSGGTLADVYPVVVVAKEAYGVVPLKGAGAIRPTVLNPGTPSKSDPLAQRGYVGWKAYFAALVLNETWMVRIEVAVSDLL
jgi:N4-gp56 family major capsid protein